MTKLTISIPDSLREFVDEQIRTKGYEDTSEYVKALLRQAQEAESAKVLEGLLLEGLESGGEDMVADERFWSELKSEATALILERKRQR